MKQVIIISGGSEGLGKEIVKALSQRHHIIIIALHEEKIDEVVKQFKCEGMVCDVSDAQAVSEAIGLVIKKHGRIDCLINNAGIWIEGEVEKNNPEEVERLMKTNVNGVIYLSQAVIPVMKKQTSGLILNIISQAGLYGKAERSVYSASKWAITGFTKSIAFELASYGVRVTGMYPGMMKTDIFSKAGSKKDLSKALSPEIVARTVAFVVETDAPTMFPEIGIKHVLN